MASSVKNGTFSAEQFNGQNNFILWQERVRNFLTREGTVKALRKKEEKPENMSEDEWQDKRDLANYTIKLCLTDNTLQEVLGLSDPAEVWDKLESRYKFKSLTTRLYLKKQFYGLRLSEGESFEKHLDEFHRLVTQMSALDEKIKDEDKALVLLASLPSSYDHIVTTLLFGKDTLKLDEVIASLLLNESRRRESGEASCSRDSVLVATSSRGRGRSDRGQGGRMGRSNSRSKLEGRSCFLCGKKGHIKKDCPRRRQDQEGRSDSQERKDQVDDPETMAFCGDLLVVHAGEAAERPCQETSWVMDSGASHHATPRKSLFRRYTPVGRGVLKMGNGGLSRVVGIGDVCLRTSNGSTLVLQGVRHAPDLRLNVISTGRLDAEGFRTTFGDGQWKLTKGASILARGSRTLGRYLMETCIANRAGMTNGGNGQGGKGGRPSGRAGRPRGRRTQQCQGRSCVEPRAELIRANGRTSRVNGGTAVAKAKGEGARDVAQSLKTKGKVSHVPGIRTWKARENDMCADKELKGSGLTPSSVVRRKVSFRLAEDSAEGKVPAGTR